MCGCEGLEPGHGSRPGTGPGAPLLLVTHPLVGDPLAANQHRAAAVVRQPGAGVRSIELATITELSYLEHY